MCSCGVKEATKMKDRNTSDRDEYTYTYTIRCAT